MLLFGVLFAQGAFAASATARIVLVGSGNVELTRKVRAEAEHVGILIVGERSTGVADAELLRRHDAVGVVELASSDRVRIHVAPSGEHAAYETIVERAPADGDGFALRVVEQVRGRLVELRLLPPEPDASDDATSAPKATGTSETPEAGTLRAAPNDARGGTRGDRALRSPTLGLAVGGWGGAALGGLGATPGVALGLRLEPASRWAATLHALLPVAENDVHAPEGAASVKVNLFLAELGYRLASPSALIQPEVGPGAGLVVLPMEGETIAPREAHTDRIVAGVYFLQAGAGYSVESWLRLRATVRSGVSAPRPVVRFSERAVAAWGRGFVVGTLEAEFQLPLSGAEGSP